jgi:thiosulfate/3-mercaptopyruvate sulfurtransferase
MILDARPEASYKLGGPGTGHIPGAVNLFWQSAVTGKDVPAMKPRAEVEQMYKQAGAVRGRTVVPYCNSGVQATHSYFTLKYLGYDVRLYDGSFSEWNGAKAPIE